MIETLENKGGGVLLYVKSKLKPQETTFTSPFKDQVWCKIADLHIGVCYRSMNYSIVGPDNNDNNLYQLLHEVSKEHFLLMGDFNFPDVNWHDYHHHHHVRLLKSCHNATCT